MRFARIGALALAALCLAGAALFLLAPTELRFCAGGDCTTVSCGSPASPKALIDFGNVEDAANCAGQTSATVALYAIVLAGGCLVVAALVHTIETRSRAREPAADGTSG